MQCTLNELIQSLCAICSNDMEKKLFPLIEDALLDFSSVDEVGLKYEGIIDGFSRSTTGFFNWSRSTISDGLGTRGTRPDASPKTVIEILSSNLDILTRFQSIPFFLTTLVPADLINQIYEQTFYFLYASIFNRIVSSRLYCSRAKGIAIRLNLSDIQEWVRDYFPSQMGIIKAVNPVIQLTQFLQVPIYYHLTFLVRNKRDRPTILPGHNYRSLPHTRSNDTGYI